MDPVSQFKFGCPNCGQHLQARAEEAGRTTQCPSCFKKLIVPQAPTKGGGKLIITAALAESRRIPQSSPGLRSSGASGASLSQALRIYLIVALVAAVAAAGGFVLLKQKRDSGDSASGASAQCWTDNFDELQLRYKPAVGELNGWDFKATHAVWKDTTLILRQIDGSPEGLRLEITFPLHGGELVSGKSWRLRGEDPPFASPILIRWKDEQGVTQSRSCPSGYLLWLQFDTVTPEALSGCLHLCLPDPTHSWVVGSFTAEVKTVVK